MELEPCKVYGSMRDLGDGSVAIFWFATLADAKADQNDPNRNGWGEECIKVVDTYVGSSTWKEAVENSQEANRE